ncbi:hypothetical protein Poly30_00780 [Planctomycetes bacterium Poly30]|uniref:Uncharacterized protein n=1 Tax=Saltatorellus ferox TaxID=2528018 RepID=A0A518EKG8_9BACT|nr:hypothetical protein Poly30_00780 [Planctomycetes bacterium Poly30]
MSHPTPFSPTSIGGQRAALLVAWAAIAPALLSGCGLGLAGGASAASGGGDGGGDLEQVSLLISESTPKLSRTPLTEPTTSPAMLPDGTLVAEPGEKITLMFSGAIDQSLTPADFRVQIKRPMEAFVDVPIERVSYPSSRSLDLELADQTVHNSVYRVLASRLRSAAGLAITGGSTTYFLVRDGKWADPELITSGTDEIGGVTVTPDLNLYATLEGSYFQASSNGIFWFHSLLSSRFGGPWQFPITINTRLSAGSEYGVQPQTGRLDFTDELGWFRIAEGDPNEGRADAFRMILRAPVGYLTPMDGLQFGDPVMITSQADSKGRIDLPRAGVSDELGGPHFSFNPALVSKHHDLGAAFWALSEPTDVTPSRNEFEHQKVYANSTSVAPYTAGGVIQWHDWDPATRLSADGENHNSWPVVTETPDGGAIAMWWSAATTVGLFDELVDRYWIAEWIPGAGWQPTVDVTPSGESGNLPALTDIKVVRRGVGASATDHVVVFTRRAGQPSARQLDLASFSWTAPMAPSPTVPGGTPYTVYQTPVWDDYVARDANQTIGYGFQLRPRVGRMTPQARSTGGNAFLVQWVERLDPNMASDTRLVVAEYRADEALPWGPPEDLSGVSVIDTDDPENSFVNLTVDQNGWATLFVRQVDAANGLGRIYAKRTNLPSNGVSGLSNQTIPGEPITPEGFDASFPSISNVHPSGALAVSWQFRLDANEKRPLGAAAARFR